MSTRGAPDAIGSGLVITRGDLAGIIAHARREAPAECCGILAGEPSGRVTRAFPMTNTRASAEEFFIDPAEQFAVLDECRAAGVAMLAAYHSHPASPARLSEYDIRLAQDPLMAHVIVSLVGDEPAVRAFRVVDGVPRELRIIVRKRR